MEDVIAPGTGDAEQETTSRVPERAFGQRRKTFVRGIAEPGGVIHDQLAADPEPPLVAGKYPGLIADVNRPVQDAQHVWLSPPGCGTSPPVCSIPGRHGGPSG